MSQCLFPFSKNKRWTQPRIELGTACDQGRNHTSRPLSPPYQFKISIKYFWSNPALSVARFIERANRYRFILCHRKKTTRTRESQLSGLKKVSSFIALPATTGGQSNLKSTAGIVSSNSKVMETLRSYLNCGHVILRACVLFSKYYVERKKWLYYFF